MTVVLGRMRIHRDDLLFFTSPLAAPLTLFSWIRLMIFACGLGVGPVNAMTLIVGSTNLEPGHAAAVTAPDGQLVRSGTGFVAVGSFGDLDDAVIRDAAGRGEALQGVLGQFQQLGSAARFGLGHGLERIDGAFQMSVSAPTRAGDGLVGRPVYVVGGTENGLFIYKSTLRFEADYPVASGSVALWGNDADLAAGLLVGGVGESIEVLELGSSGHSIRLSAVDGAVLDLTRFEESMVDPPAAPPVVAGDPAPPVSNAHSPLSAPDPPIAEAHAHPVVTEIEKVVVHKEPMERLPEWIERPRWLPDPMDDLFWEATAFLELDIHQVQTMGFTMFNRTHYSFLDSGVGDGAGVMAVTLVPEPGSALLIVIGGLLILRRSRR